MSSCGNPEVEQDAVMPRRRKYDKSRTCVKCKTNVGNIVIRHAVYCRACFVPLMTFKFRRSLEPYVNAKPDGPRRTALKPTGHLLVGCSGGLGSTVLLDLVNRCYVSPDPSLLTQDGGKDHPSKDKVWKKVHVCYVEVCDAIPGAKDRTEDIRNVLHDIPGIEFIALRIQDAFDRSWWKSVALSGNTNSIRVNLSDEMLPYIPAENSNETPLSALQSYLDSLPTSTAIATALQTLTRVLLQYTALQTGSSHLLLGNSLTSLAVSLISSVSQGGGFHVKEEVQEEWTPSPPLVETSAVKTVRLIRPLRDVSTKECATWAWWWRLHIVGKEQWAWTGVKPGIGRLTKDFIRGLEKDYPSTVSTIVRTCGKLAPKGETSGQCVLCRRPAQAGVQEWKARIAIRSRNAVSEPEASVAPHMSDVLASNLCYVCHTTLTSKGTRALPSLFPSNPASPTAVPMPAWVAPIAPHSHDDVEDDEPVVVSRRKMGEEELRAAIDGFILKD